MPKMPKNVSADKSLRREQKRNKQIHGMVVDGRSALFNRTVNRRNRKSCPQCGKPKNKKAKLCKDCLHNPMVQKSSIA